MLCDPNYKVIFIATLYTINGIRYAQRKVSPDRLRTTDLEVDAAWILWDLIIKDWVGGYRDDLAAETGHIFEDVFEPSGFPASEYWE